MKKTIFMLSAIAMLGFSACKNSGMTLRKEPFNDFVSDKEYFRAVGVGTNDVDRMADKISRTDAQLKISEFVKILISNVFEDYLKTNLNSSKNETNGNIDNKTQSVTDEILKNLIVKKREVYTLKNGDFKIYTAMEVSKNELKEEIKKSISNESKMRNEFDEERFNQRFDDALKRFSEKQK